MPRQRKCQVLGRSPETRDVFHVHLFRGQITCSGTVFNNIPTVDRETDSAVRTQGRGKKQRQERTGGDCEERVSARAGEGLVGERVRLAWLRIPKPLASSMPGKAEGSGVVAFFFFP